MIKFLNKEAEEYYRHLIELHDEWKAKNLSSRQYEFLEVRDYGEAKMVHWPTSLYWWKFSGTFQELHDMLKKDLPLMCPDVRFYSIFSSPIII